MSHYFDYVKELGGEYIENWVCEQLAEEFTSRDLLIARQKTEIGRLQLLLAQAETNYERAISEQTGAAWTEEYYERELRRNLNTINPDGISSLAEFRKAFGLEEPHFE
jgi:hypothetical protein